MGFYLFTRFTFFSPTTYIQSSRPGTTGVTQMCIVYVYVYVCVYFICIEEIKCNQLIFLLVNTENGSLTPHDG